MMDLFSDPNLLPTFALLIGLELVLGIDNILLISIITSRLPQALQDKARIVGLTLALLFRVLMLMGVSSLQRMVTPVFFSMSVKDLVLLVGGLFLLYKAVKEMHHVVERSHDSSTSGVVYASFGAAVVQIVAIDAVFSIDSVITAVGLTENLTVIFAAVLLSFGAVLAFSKTISEFVRRNPSLKILALSFLLCIGVTLCMEAFHQEIPKGYLYLPMGFALFVELIQLRYEFKRSQRP